ncbi:MAG: DUF3150 domain-containing protein [Candidatus Caldarchaeum sp.]
MSIREKALLGHLRISMWTGRKLDRDISEEVASNHSASSKAGRYNKHLLPNCKELDRIQQLSVSARNWFYSQTVPWTIGGVQLIPSRRFSDIYEELNNRAAEFNAAVDDFLAGYNKHVEEAKVALGGLFREEDYPTPERLRTKFAFSTAFYPVPEADFRVSVSEEEKAALKEQLEASIRDAEAQAMKAVWQRVYDTLAHVARQLREGKRFHASMFANIASLANILPDLNISDDPKLTELTDELRNSLVGVNVEHVRSDDSFRRDTAAQAQRIADKVSAYL